MKKFLLLIFIVVASVIFFSCAGEGNEAQASACSESECGTIELSSDACAGCPSAKTEAIIMEDRYEMVGLNSEYPLVTFVELGSLNCIPCKKMQPVMKSVEEKYGQQIKVKFYDVWKTDQKKYATEFNIRLIPTQVFLDKNGKEIFRHEGFFPEAEIDKLLKAQGLKPNQES